MRLSRNLLWSALLVFMPLSAGDRIEAVQKVLVSSIRALSSGDILTARSLCTADYQLLEKGEVWDLEQDLAAAKEAMDHGLKRTDAVEFKLTKIVGNAAYTVYLLTSTMDKNGQITKRQWLESAVLVKGKMGWRISLVHSTEIPEPIQGK